ncbi:MAG TPA: hypothetical protein VKU36_03920 [Candidatus Babeliales bacterium]|nr:hypothetical protein [Candidatus Babeliales bacterium]
MKIILPVSIALLFTFVPTYSMEKIENFFHHQHHHTTTKATNSSDAYYSKDISEGKKKFLINRLPIVKAALEKMLNRSLNNKKIPNIALVCSGGGYRAMLCTTGSLCGAKKIGLLDATQEIAALSGSTWAVAPWISTKLPIKKFKEYIQTCAAKPFEELTLEEEKLIAAAFAVKNAYHQSLTLVDPYGFLLGNRLLDALADKRQSTTLSDQAQTVESGAYPYPSYAAIDGRDEIITGQTWYKFTPHTIENLTNNIQIPTHLYGKKFEKGKVDADDNTPEKPLAYSLATCGSAFAASIHTILQQVIHNHLVLEIIEKFLPASIDGDRLLPFWAKVPNYMYQMENVHDKNLSEKKNLKLVDAGLSGLNLPFPAIAHADIIIFLDASGGQMGKQLQRAAAYAKDHNLPFPAIDSDTVGQKTFSIFKDEQNSSAPVVMYLPRISDPVLWEENRNKEDFGHYNLLNFNLDRETREGFAKTQHFQYTPEHSTLVMNQTEFNMRVNKDNIINAIDEWIIKNNS